MVNRDLFGPYIRLCISQWLFGLSNNYIQQYDFLSWNYHNYTSEALILLPNNDLCMKVHRVSGPCLPTHGRPSVLNLHIRVEKAWDCMESLQQSTTRRTHANNSIIHRPGCTGARWYRWLKKVSCSSKSICSKLLSHMLSETINSLLCERATLNAEALRNANRLADYQTVFIIHHLRNRLLCVGDELE